MLPGSMGRSEMGQVFISFVHEEQAVAEALQKFIEDVLQVSTFVSCDQRAVFAGDHWLERIKDALKCARVVVLILSRESVARPWVNFEAGAAWLQGIPIIPVVFKNLKLNEIPTPYSSLQSLDLMQATGQYYLITSIAHRLGGIAPIIGSPLEAYSRLQQSLADACPPE